MGRVQPFLFVVIRTSSGSYDVVAAGSDEAERYIVVFGPAAEAACWRFVSQNQNGEPTRHAG